MKRDNKNSEKSFYSTKQQLSHSILLGYNLITAEFLLLL